jgi:predicted RecA/RadA family phage recombinase
MKNLVYDGKRLQVVPTHPASGVLSGGEVRWGSRIGVAVMDQRSDNKVVIRFTGVFNLSVKAVNDAGNSAVAIGDKLYFVDADSPHLSKKTSGYFAGEAMEAINSGDTATIMVRLSDESVPPMSGDATISAAGVISVKQMGVSAKGTVVAHAGDGAIAAADVAKIHTNTGAVGTATLTLPAAADARGKSMKVQVTAAQIVRLDPGAEKIYLGGDGVADKYLQIAGVIGNYADLYCDGTDWLVQGYSGVLTKEA